MSAPDDELVEALLHRIKVGLATVPAGGPTDRLLQQCSEVIRALRDALARDAQMREIAPDAVWMAKLARGGSWPGGMAHAVDQAANKVITALGDDADRAALDAVASVLRDGKG